MNLRMDRPDYPRYAPLWLGFHSLLGLNNMLIASAVISGANSHYSRAPWVSRESVKRK